MTTLNSTILVLANDFPDERDERPVGIFIKEQVRAIAESGLRQVVIVPYPAGLERYRNTRYFDYETVEGVSVHFLRYSNPLFPLQWYTWRKGWIQLETRALERYLQRKKLRPSLIQAHFTWPTGAVAAALARHLSVPLVITEHAHTTIDSLIDSRDPILMHAWRVADAVVRVSTADVKRIEACAGRDKVHVIPNGHDQTLMRPGNQAVARRTLGLSQHRRLLFTLGGLHSYKGHTYLVAAMHELAKQHTDLDLVIGGDGPLRNKLTRQVAGLGLQERVRLIGRLRHLQVPTWMAACDLFVLPSVVESFGIVQVEALACGRPVVATHNRASQDVIADGSHGILCPPADPGAIAQSINVALARPWVEEVLVQRAKEFTWAANASAYRDLYASILEGAMS